MEATLYCPRSFSLKDKRRLVKAILDRTRHRFNVSAAEVDFQDHHRQSKLAFSLVGNDQTVLEQSFEKIEQELLKRAAINVRDVTRTIF